MALTSSCLGQNIRYNTLDEQTKEVCMESVVDVMVVVGHVIAIASVIVKLTPDPKDDAFLAKVMKVLKFLSLAK
jgi:hypothetical protein